jgi:N4-gp56 family major capsid protein
MAITSIATTHDLTNEQWEAQLYKKAQEKTFFGKFKGTAQGSIVQVKRQLEKKPGDAITFGLSDSIRGTVGVSGNNVLEGHNGTTYTTNNEALKFYDQQVKIDQIRQSIKIAGVMDEKRVAFNLRNEARDKLVDWMSWNEDQALFTALSGADLIGESGSGSTVNIADASLSYDAIVDMKKEALFPTDGNIDGTATTRRLDPIRIENGEEVFILGVNPSDMATFKKSDDYKNFNQYGDYRGEKNSLFTGACGMWNGVIVHEHSGFQVGKPVLMGANALFLAYGKEIMYGEDTFDYNNQTGFMIGTIRGTALARFLDSTDSDADQGSNGAIKFDITVAD